MNEYLPCKITKNMDKNRIASDISEIRLHE